jgi:hypothetical protein
MGLRVFPLVPGGKTPLTTHGLKDATLDIPTINAWWGRRPDANIGIATGAASNVVVLDIDGREGEESLKAFPPFRLGWSVNTPRGMHFYFSHPGHEVRNSAGKLGVGLDVRGDGGYVAAPPSLHPSGDEYEWCPAKRWRWLEPWPEFFVPPVPEPVGATLRPAATRPSVNGRGNRYAVAALEAEAETVRTASVGTRNDTLNRAGHAVFRFPELSPREVWDVLLAAATAAGLSEDEARRTLASALKARRRRDRRP